MKYVSSLIFLLTLQFLSWICPAVLADDDKFLRIGTLAPDFEFSTINGENVRLSALRGRVVLLNIWTAG